MTPTERIAAAQSFLALASGPLLFAFSRLAWHSASYVLALATRVEHGSAIDAATFEAEVLRRTEEVERRYAAAAEEEHARVAAGIAQAVALGIDRKLPQLAALVMDAAGIEGEEERGRVLSQVFDGAQGQGWRP